MTGAERIAAERQRQVDREGWTPEHDDQHDHGELRHAAAAYLKANGRRLHVGLHDGRYLAWPWDAEWWKPTGDKVRDLVKAGALIAAEIDRLERARSAEEREEGVHAC